MGSGPWTAQENVQFEHGCVRHGWGNWKRIVGYVPSRTKIQIKSHAQKVQKNHPARKRRLVEEHKRTKSARKANAVNAAVVTIKSTLPRKKSGGRRRKTTRATVRRADGGEERSETIDDANASRIVTKDLDTPTAKTTEKKDTGAVALPRPSLVDKPQKTRRRKEPLDGTIAFPISASAKAIASSTTPPVAAIPATSPADATPLKKYISVETPLDAPRDRLTEDISYSTSDEVASMAEPRMGEISDILSIGTPTDQTKGTKKEGNFNEDEFSLRSPLSNENVADFNWNEPDEDDPIDTPSRKEALDNLHDEIDRDEKRYDQIFDALTAGPDFNDRNEYVVRNDGLTRTALGTPALMRARIKLMLEQQQNLWMGAMRQSPNGDAFCVEQLIALIVVLHDVTDWSLKSSSASDDDNADNGHFTPYCEFDEEDDILHIGQAVAGLWERVDRSLSRDAYGGLGVDGLKRGGAINRIVGILAHNSRVAISHLA